VAAFIDLIRRVIREAPIFSRQKINDAVQSVKFLPPEIFSCDRRSIAKCHLSVALIARGSILAIVAYALRHLIGSHRSSVNREGASMPLEFVRDLTAESLGETKINTPLVGSSARMKIVHGLIAKLANNNATVLITGESGTGKELAARAIHELSPRRGQSFVPVNCGAIPEELLESELFGHVRGAFTGALNARQGRFQLAHAGTLFLDEIGEMSPKLQVKLLRVLQEQQFEPVGSDHGVQVDVRVVAATNTDLRAVVREGKFREDLFYRLNVLPLELPSLREREGDIALLIRYFLQLHGSRKGRAALRVELATLELLEKYRWPGNVRELENLIERLVVMNDDGTIRAGELPDYVVQNSLPQHHGTSGDVSLPLEGVDLDGFLERIENGFIHQALKRTRGNKTTAADLLNLNRTTFIERLRKKGMLQTVRRPAAGDSTARQNSTAHVESGPNFSAWNTGPSLFADQLSLADVTV
jgi:transcriptional regulator with PAS, ATPase and Fis domain